MTLLYHTFGGITPNRTIPLLDGGRFSKPFEHHVPVTPYGQSSWSCTNTTTPQTCHASVKHYRLIFYFWFVISFTNKQKYKQKVGGIARLRSEVRYRTQSLSRRCCLSDNCLFHDSISVINYNINYSRKAIEKPNSVVGRQRLALCSQV